MPYDNLSDVQKEAYVNADVDLVTMSTLEIDHDAFSSPIRIVRDANSLSAGGMTFQPFWFEFVPPEITGDPDPTFDIQVSNANGALTPYLEIATEASTPITVIYRTFLYNVYSGSVLNGGSPSADPMTMECFTVALQNNSATFTIVMAPIANKSFPNLTYTPDEFPGLQTA